MSFSRNIAGSASARQELPLEAHLPAGGRQAPRRAGVPAIAANTAAAAAAISARTLYPVPQSRPISLSTSGVATPIFVLHEQQISLAPTSSPPPPPYVDPTQVHLVAGSRGRAAAAPAPVTSVVVHCPSLTPSIARAPAPARSRVVSPVTQRNGGIAMVILGVFLAIIGLAVKEAAIVIAATVLLLIGTVFVITQRTHNPSEVAYSSV